MTDTLSDKTYRLVFIIQGYESEDALGNMNNVCTFEFYAESEEDAINKAKKLVNKKFYRVNKVIEVKNG